MSPNFPLQVLASLRLIHLIRTNLERNAVFLTNFVAIRLVCINNIFAIGLRRASQPVATVVIQLRDVRTSHAGELVSHVVKCDRVVQRPEVGEDASSGAGDVDVGCDAKVRIEAPRNRLF